MMVLVRVAAILSIVALTAAATGEEGRSHRLRSLPQTHGVNYEFADPRQHPDYVAGSHLGFSADIVIGPLGMPITIVSDPISRAAGSSCNGPCSRVAQEGEASGAPHHDYVNCRIDARGALCELRILRFAQFGKLPPPLTGEWLVVMADGEDLLGGTMKTTLDADGNLVYPAPAELSGRMIFTVQMAGQPPMRMVSRKNPLFRGTIPAWPPHGASFQLVNAPIEYYLESDVDKPDARPMATVTANGVQLGEKSDFFAMRPEIRSVTSVDGGGFRITWSETAGAVAEPKPTRYHVYRNLQGGALGRWERIATVPAGTSSYVDRDVPKGRAAEYLVSHATDYPFGYEYEGVFGMPASSAPRRKPPR